ncbi:hypothetical protein CPB85DRAFT_1427189 [Mucidula mucida]|nr:hypothetical protein CPB85DRAFT_1427189 [Mucidula mucida]
MNSTPPLRRSSRFNPDSGSKRALPDDDDSVDIPSKKRSTTTAKQEVFTEKRAKPTAAKKGRKVQVSSEAIFTENDKQKASITPNPPKPSNAEFKKAWQDWCKIHKWKPDPTFQPNYGSPIMHSSEAIRYFVFQRGDLEVVPYSNFPNEHNPSRPGRAYRYKDLLKLAYRKEAFRHGIPNAAEEPDATTEKAMLAAGQAQFKLAMAHRDEMFQRRTEKKEQEGKLKAGESKKRKGPTTFPWPVKFSPPI